MFPGTALRRELAALDLAERFYESPLEGREIRPAATYRDPEVLRDQIRRSASQHATEDAPALSVDPRAAAARFMRQYGNAVIPAVLVALAHGVGLDASLERCAIVVKGAIPRGLCLLPGDTLVCDERPSRWPVDGRRVASLEELRETVVRRLLSEHLVPLMDDVLEVAHLAPDLLWTNVAECIALIVESAAEHLGEGAAPLIEDQRILLERATLPGIAGPNPLLGLVRWVPVSEADFPGGLLVRKVCCIGFAMPDRPGRYCGNCPLLDASELVEIVRSRRAADDRRSSRI